MPEAGNDSPVKGHYRAEPDHAWTTGDGAADPAPDRALMGPGCRSGMAGQNTHRPRITSRAGNDALGRFRGAVFATETDVRRELLTT